MEASPKFFADSEYPHSNASHASASSDPLDAFYALNIGDFLAENFISEELLERIHNNRSNQEPLQIKRQLEELIQIYSVDKTLGVLGFNVHEDFILYDSIAATLAEMFQVDACHLFQTSRQNSGKSTLQLTGSSVPVDPHTRFEIVLRLIESDLLSEIYDSGDIEVVHLAAKPHPTWHPDKRLHQEKAKSLLAVPLKEGSRGIGLLLLESYEPENFLPEALELAKTTAHVFVIAIHLQQLVMEAQEIINEDDAPTHQLVSLRAQITENIADLGIYQQSFIEALAGAIDARHHYTRGQSQHVAHIAKRIGEVLQLNEKTLDLIYYAGLFGNIGKLHLPDAIIDKKESLTTEEWDALKTHPNVGVSLLMQIHFLAEILPFIKYQNERWDGSGNPQGLSGKSIPLGARILGVANAYTAMMQERPYRDRALTHEETITSLAEEAGKKWDPKVVETLAKLHLL